MCYGCLAHFMEIHLAFVGYHALEETPREPVEIEMSSNQGRRSVRRSRPNGQASGGGKRAIT